MIAGGGVVIALDCYVGGLPFESGILPQLNHASGERWLAAMLAIKRSAGVTLEVNLRECTSYMPLPHANKLSTLALKPKEDVTRSPKQGYEWPHKRPCVCQIFFKKPKKEADRNWVPFLTLHAYIRTSIWKATGRKILK